MTSALDLKTFPAWEFKPGIRYIRGYFLPNGSSAIVNASNVGDVDKWTVAWTSTGLYTVTLVPTFQAIENIGHTLQLTTAADCNLQVGVVSGQTFQLRNLTAGSLADIASDAGNKIHFTVKLRASTSKG